MNSDKGSQIRLATYRDNLLIQLRLLDVPGEQIGQILAEVETHVADTGLDPVDAFGDPGEYAATYVAAAANSPIGQGASRSWARNLGVAGVSGIAGSAATVGALHFTGSVDVTVRLVGTWLVTVAIALVVVRFIFGQLAADTAGSVKSWTFTSRYAVLGGLAYLCAFAVLGLIPLLLPAGPVLASVPGWVLLAAGALAMFALVRRLGGDRVVDPRGWGGRRVSREGKPAGRHTELVSHRRRSAVKRAVPPDLPFATGSRSTKISPASPTLPV